MTKETAPVAMARYITVRTAAGLLGVHESTVQRWCKAGAIPGRQGMTRGRWLIPVAALRERFDDLRDRVETED